jgi:hypothetical protein
MVQPPHLLGLLAILPKQTQHGSMVCRCRYQLKICIPRVRHRQICEFIGVEWGNVHATDEKRQLVLVVGMAPCV